MEGVKKDVYEEKWKMEEEGKGKTGCFSKFLDRRWISLAILVFVNLINYADRYSLSAVLGVSCFLSFGLYFGGHTLHDPCVRWAPKDALKGPRLTTTCGPRRKE